MFFVIYYVVFRFTITRFNLLTPGRELAVSGSEADGYDVIKASSGKKSNDTAELAQGYLQALGGKANLIGIDACITRLRLNVADSSLVDDALAKRLGAAGVIRLNKQSVQIVVGTQAESIATALKVEHAKS